MPVHTTDSKWFSSIWLGIALRTHNSFSFSLCVFVSNLIAFHCINFPYRIVTVFWNRIYYTHIISLPNLNKRFVFHCFTQSLKFYSFSLKWKMKINKIQKLIQIIHFIFYSKIQLLLMICMREFKCKLDIFRVQKWYNLPYSSFSFSTKWVTISSLVKYSILICIFSAV